MSTEVTQDEPVHQKVGWLELFYDLVFVVVIEQLTQLLHDNPDGARIRLVFGLTFLVWLAWFNVSALTNISGEIGPRGRPFIFASMAGIGVLSLGIEEVPHKRAWLFALGYAIARSSIWPLWLRGHRPHGRAWLRPILFGPGISLLWLLVGLLHTTKSLIFGFVLIALAEMAFSGARPDPGSSERMHGPHMAERIGLLLMIVLGESVAQIVAALEGHRTHMMWVCAAFAMALLGALWWLIYEATMKKFEDAMERDDSTIGDFIGVSQLFIVTGLIMMAAGIADAIHVSGTAGAHIHRGSLTCLCFGQLFVLGGVTSMSRRAFAVDLGLKRESREAERERQRERRAQRVQDPSGTRHHQGPPVKWQVSQGLKPVFLIVPLVILRLYGTRIPPWTIMLGLFVYVAWHIYSEGLNDVRVRHFFAEFRELQSAGKLSPETGRPLPSTESQIEAGTSTSGMGEGPHAESAASIERETP